MSEDNLKHVMDVAREAATFQPVMTTTTAQAVYIPRGPGGDGAIVTVDMEKHMREPARKRGAVIVFDAASMNLILDANQGQQIVVYVDRMYPSPAIIAIMNDHGAQPGWRDHRVNLAFRTTPQWQKWLSIDGKMMPQTEFAEFIEENLPDITEPAGAAMLEVAQYFSATRDVSFKSAVRLKDGQIQFQNEERIEAKVGAGNVEVPDTIGLGLAPYFGVAPFRVEAKFRYRIRDGKLSLGIKLQRVEDIVSHVVEETFKGLILPPGALLVDGRPE